MEKSINVLLLSAGLGTRLRPLTLNKPKCLVEINNKPLMEHWFDKLEQINVRNVLVNTHYLPEQVNKFLDLQVNRNFKIHKFHEEKLLGTAATLITNIDFFSNSTGILIHADNYSQLDLKLLLEAHNSRPPSCLLTMLTFNSISPETCGIVEVDSKNVVKNFYEKIKNPPSNRANGAIYVFEDQFLKWLIKNYPNAKDFSTEIIPNLLRKIYTFHTRERYFDIGNPEALKMARDTERF